MQKQGGNSFPLPEKTMNCRITGQSSYGISKALSGAVLPRLLTAVLFTLPSLAAFAETTPVESLSLLVHDALTDRAETLSRTILNSHFEVSLDAIPAPAQLSECDQTPEITFLTSASPGTQRIRIECSAPVRWALYARGTIDVYVPVLVSRRTLARGETVTANDFEFREKNLSVLRRGYLLDNNLPDNQQLARRLSAGDVLTPQMLQPAHLIQRGDRITINASNDSFTISMPGEALEDGVLDQLIRVRNLSSGKTVRGIVSGKTEVNVL